MPSQRNLNDLEYLKDRLTAAKSVVFADYKGLTVSQLQQLRSQIKSQGAEMKVLKNTLLKLGLKAACYPTAGADKELAGPTAAVFSLEDEIAPMKALADFSQSTGLPKFKAGFLGKVFLSADRVRELAALPGREILLAKLMGTLNTPMTGLINVMQGNVKKLVYVLEAIKHKQKS